MGRKRRKRPGGQPGKRAETSTAGNAESNRPQGRWLWLACATVALLAGALYSRTIAFDYTYLDDDLLIANDQAFLSNPANVPRVFGRKFFGPRSTGEGYYRPLVTLTFMANAAMTGKKLSSYHATNLLLHMLVSALVVFALAQLGFGLWPSAAAGAIFAVHPVLCNAVVWIPGRVYLLLAVFTLAALVCFVRWARSGRLVWFAGHAVAFAAGLLCQEATVIVPLLLAGWLWVARQRRPLLRSPLLWLVWGGLLVGWAIVWKSVVVGGPQRSLGDHAQALVVHFPALLTYFGKSVVPYGLSVLPVIEDSPWVPGAVVLAALAGAAWLLRGEQLRWYLWGLGWFVAGIAPSLLKADFVILEGRLYVPLFGLLVALLVLARRLAALPRRRERARLALVAVGIVVAGYASIAWRLSESYRDRDTFTAQAVATSPHAALAHQSRGLVLYRAGQLEQAATHFRQAIEIKPRVPVVNGNLGSALLSLGRLDEAERHLQRELSLNPGNAQAHFNLATLHKRRGQAERALMHFQLATEFDPDNIDAWGELLSAYARQGKWAEAERCRREMQRRGVSFHERKAP